MDPRNYGNNPRRPNFSQNIPQTPQNFPQIPQNCPQYPPNMYQNPQYDPLYFQDPGFQQFMYQQYQSQQQTLPNFTGSGNYAENEEENLEKETGGDDDVEELDPFQAAQISQQSKKQWSMADDEALISCYMNNSCDPRVGTNQKKNDLWKKVTASFNSAQLSNPNRISQRNSEMLKGRWRRITGAVTKWVAAFEEASARKRSGMNDEDVIREAHIVYTATHNSKFPFYDQWKMLQRYPKWDSIVRVIPSPAQQRSGETNSSGKRVRLDDDGEERFTPTNAGTPISDEADFLGHGNRPEGVKKAKNKGKKKVSQGSSHDQSAIADKIVEFGSVIKNKQKVDVDSLSQKFEAQKEIERMKMFQALLVRGEDNLTQFEKKIFFQLAKEFGFDV